jgi:hypothetical protein
MNPFFKYLFRVASTDRLRPFWQQAARQPGSRQQATVLQQVFSSLLKTFYCLVYRGYLMPYFYLPQINFYYFFELVKSDEFREQIKMFPRQGHFIPRRFGAFKRAIQLYSIVE